MPNFFSKATKEESLNYQNVKMQNHSHQLICLSERLGESLDDYKQEQRSWHARISNIKKPSKLLFIDKYNNVS